MNSFDSFTKLKCVLVFLTLKYHSFSRSIIKLRKKLLKLFVLSHSLIQPSKLYDQNKIGISVKLLLKCVGVVLEKYCCRCKKHINTRGSCL